MNDNVHESFGRLALSLPAMIDEFSETSVIHYEGLEGTL